MGGLLGDRYKKAACDTDLDRDIVETSRDSLSIASSTNLLMTSSSMPQGSPSTSAARNQSALEEKNKSQWKARENIEPLRDAGKYAAGVKCRKTCNWGQVTVNIQPQPMPSAGRTRQVT